MLAEKEFFLWSSIGTLGAGPGGAEQEFHRKDGVVLPFKENLEMERRGRELR